jgi:hypothetical protein
MEKSDEVHRSQTGGFRMGVRGGADITERDR